MRLLATQNPYPDCVSLELTTTTVDSTQFDLYLHLQFNQQRMPLSNGSIKFGLKGGELKLKLENSQFSSANPDFDATYQITATASKNNPAWMLAPKLGQSLLEGSSQGVKLGTVEVTGESYQVMATFEVSPSDISLTDAEGLWRHDISPNKHGILERKIVLFLWENQLTPYLSFVRLGAQESPSESPSIARRKEEISSEILCQLERVIAQVYEAKTDDFLELAQLAQLNPLEDFAGGNLLAAELSGVALGGANLARTNLRGANLTDADLSEANLSYAKFGGADLSGAYLGNANLSHADLHSSSLALANLIGADLSYANLRQANLSQANLSGAQVGGAQFEQNEGISPEMQQSLKERSSVSG
jgi:hypothetical protein